MTQSDPTLIGGRYELGELLGRGGMAEVRKGKDLRLGRTVAVKRLRTDLASDATFQARFRREAQSSASLNHPAIVSTYDTGEEMATDGSGVAQPYIVMECVEGRTLRDILREGRKILPERALEITAGVLSALDYSHRAGIIHRDIKPGNVMLTPTGDVKVMDFGIARAISDASSTMTQTAAVVGTAQYLSPEQARGETVDSRSDVYSTGCMLYELLTGRPPFVGDSPVAVAYQHVREQAAPPSDLDDQLDPEIDAIVMKSLAKRVEDRYQSSAAMKADIERYLSGHPIQAPAVVPAAETAYVAAVPPADATTTMTSGPPPREPQESRGRTAWWILGGLLAVLLLGAGAWALNGLLFEDSPERLPVPNLVGLTEQEARLKIVDAGLRVGEVDREPSETVEADLVISQDPNRDVFADPDSSVDFVLSLGRPEVEVPYVVGTLRKDARAAMIEQGLKVRFEEEDSDEPRNQVLSTAPPAGTSVADGTTITIVYSDGPAQVPDVRGLRQGQAERTIREAGFVPDVRVDAASVEPRGTVVDQIPVGGTADQGSTVTIFVSAFVEPTETPTETPTTPTETPTETPTTPTETPTLPTETPTTPTPPRVAPGTTPGSASRR
ncbi:Stk1 family PASTA domain-containing Ser/Thr kinase [Nocardioides sp. S-58]|uniref:non-specific serine/threonine protein kinase n=1 Tax=Nocardioides renjunii TaxID=3095075 RepID=A0ABU5K8Y6_9ACTN|nr:Stk1 family PASTA domain-containing Ser/Thr kinase [Nocardioides sp. S-58]MDZ5661425.1 Stk1 family PASTA domain-containing Ser/Thr kinase [Nocardioides sp. S-58]